jgi:chromate transporter
MSDDGNARSSWVEVLRVFLLLGVTSFGGPVAHLGYFREAFVARRRWLSEAAYADLVALAQFLPGPASSQVGMAIGLARAGLPGLLAAWVGFTLPSALLMIGFAWGTHGLPDATGTGWIAGLKLAALAVVAHAVISMARTLAPDRPRASIAVLAMVWALLLPGSWGQVGAIVMGALAGLAFCRADPMADRTGIDLRIPTWMAGSALLLFATLLLGLPVAVALDAGPVAALADAFYRAGALVFGGGHVVLPLLEAGVVEPGMVDRDAFLAGYGAAQALPGPLLAFSAYLGAINGSGPSGLAGATLALVAIFLPSMLLVVGVLPFWASLGRMAGARRALMGINAAVVGLLAAVLYDPVFTSAIDSALSMGIAAIAFVLIGVWRTPPWAVVIIAGIAGGVLL